MDSSDSRFSRPTWRPCGQLVPYCSSGPGFGSDRAVFNETLSSAPPPAARGSTTADHELGILADLCLLFSCRMLRDPARHSTPKSDCVHVCESLDTGWRVRRRIE